MNTSVENKAGSLDWLKVAGRCRADWRVAYSQIGTTKTRSLSVPRAGLLATAAVAILLALQTERGQGDLVVAERGAHRGSARCLANESRNDPNDVGGYCHCLRVSHLFYGD